MSNRLPEAFSKNRNEETGEDNWSDFIVPHFIHNLGIQTQTKAHIIQGGRGCGKTTLLRYFCHATQFSPRRHEVRDNDLNHIGLYWRADTNFLNSFSGGDQDDATWRAAFDHLLACELGKEIIRALRSLNCNDVRRAQFGRLDDVDLRDLQHIDANIGTNLNDLDDYLRRARGQLSMWINNLDCRPHPTFLPATAFLLELISLLRGQLPYLKDSTFAVFIDEYENLREEQQRFINGMLKHAKPPLLFNIAMKRNGLMTGATIGHEAIEDISDYRTIDLEAEFEGNFELFAAELLFFRLLEVRPQLESSLPIKVEKLRSVEIADIHARFENPLYKVQMLTVAARILPRVTDHDAAAIVLSDEKLRSVLTERVKTALTRKSSVIPATEFIDDEHPAASVVVASLLHRERGNPDELLKDFQKAVGGHGGRLAVGGDLIANNLFGCVNSIYLQAQRISILFSGFTALTLMARNNTRHFLELVHRIFRAYEDEPAAELPLQGEEPLPIVPPGVQANAVRDASELILGQVKGHGTYGPQLYALVQCIGSIFRERHRNEKQSEPEINHFTIQTGDITPTLQRYLSEAEKWSVLLLSRETKMKSAGAPNSDFVLNPIFAPNFQISYRKKRSLQVSAVQLLQMLDGDQQARDHLVRELGRQGPSNMELDLFRAHT